MSDKPTLAQTIERTVEKMREPLDLDRWQVRIHFGPVPPQSDDKDIAAAVSAPEYRIHRLYFDLDAMETGDEVDELVAHEMAHAHIWPLHNVAEFSHPADDRFAQEMVRESAERTTTAVGHTYLRLLRRLWKVEEELRRLKAERKQRPIAPA